jgi:uncharacterized protein
LRIVRTPDGSVVADPTGRLAGRGAYVCHQDACRAQAITKGALSRALHTAVPPDAKASIEAALTTDIIEGGARGQE